MSSSRRAHSRNSAHGQHRARRKPRIRLAVTGAAALAALGGGTAFACFGGPHQAPPAAGHDEAGGTTASDGHGWGGRPVGFRPTAPATASSTHRPHHPGQHSPTPTAKPTGSPTAAPTKPAPTPTATTTRPAPPATTAPTAPSSDDAVQQVLDLINRNRADQGLAPYTLLAGLNKSAAAHNQVMASGCGLSHQCPGEPAFGDRETAAGVHWMSAGENIGEGGGVGSSASEIAKSAVGLTQMMLDEKAPNDGHRRNILSSGFTHIGIDVYRDANGTVWMTQDFAN
ncbi:CAP domain-containing protein [Actinacidiphila alni]|uniref:CAP domain-containing protein n=1 Tax=Actinacidiphila alni TaxID=380248 RepID=UPI003453F991